MLNPDTVKAIRTDKATITAETLEIGNAKIAIIETPQYDSETGDQLENKRQMFSIQQLREEKAKCQKKIEAINTILTNLKED